jgi:hypothetical protein
VVPTALHIDPETARVTAKSDPIPHVLAGIPLDLRSVAVKLDRSRFTLNPTSRNPFSFDGEAICTRVQFAARASLHSPASQPVEVDAVARIDSHRGGIRATFGSIPDHCG